MSETRFVGSIEITISISILPLATRKGGTNRSKERKGNREGDNDGVRRVRASATSHVNIWLCVRYGGVRPVCMETKALPSWTTGVEPLVERSCLPTPRWTTRRNTLPFLSLSPSLSSTAVLFSLALLLVPAILWFLLSLDISFSHLPRMLRLRQSIIAGSLRRRFYRYRQGRSFRSRGRRDLSALTIAHSIVSRRSAN